MKRVICLMCLFVFAGGARLYGQSATSTIHWINPNYRSKGKRYIRICTTDETWGMKGKYIYFKARIYYGGSLVGSKRYKGKSRFDHSLYKNGYYDVPTAPIVKTMSYRKFNPSAFMVKITLSPVSNPSWILAKAQKKFNFDLSPSLSPKTKTAPTKSPSIPKGVSATLRNTAINPSYFASGGQEMVKINTTIQVNYGKGKAFRFECRLYRGENYISGAYLSGKATSQYPYAIWKNYWFGFLKTFLYKKLGRTRKTLKAVILVRDISSSKVIGRVEKSFYFGEVFSNPTPPARSPKPYIPSPTHYQPAPKRHTPPKRRTPPKKKSNLKNLKSSSVQSPRPKMKNNNIADSQNPFKLTWSFVQNTLPHPNRTEKQYRSPKKADDLLYLSPRMVGEWVAFCRLDAQVERDFQNGKRNNLRGYWGLVYLKLNKDGRGTLVKRLTSIYLKGPNKGVPFFVSPVLKSNLQEWGIAPLYLDKAKREALVWLYLRENQQSFMRGVSVFHKNLDRKKDRMEFVYMNERTHKLEKSTLKANFYRKEYFFQKKWPEWIQTIQKQFPAMVNQILQNREEISRMQSQNLYTQMHTTTQMVQMNMTMNNIYTNTITSGF